MRYYKRIDKEGNITTVEKYSHNIEVEGAVEIDKEDYDTFIASLPEPVFKPDRDLAKELDQLKTKYNQLKLRVDSLEA